MRSICAVLKFYFDQGAFAEFGSDSQKTIAHLRGFFQQRQPQPNFAGGARGDKWIGNAGHGSRIHAFAVILNCQIQPVAEQVFADRNGDRTERRQRRCFQQYPGDEGKVRASGLISLVGPGGTAGAAYWGVPDRRLLHRSRSPEPGCRRPRSGRFRG